jgi:hypothetical protein
MRAAGMPMLDAVAEAPAAAREAAPEADADEASLEIPDACLAVLAKVCTKAAVAELTASATPYAAWAKLRRSAEVLVEEAEPEPERTNPPAAEVRLTP